MANRNTPTTLANMAAQTPAPAPAGQGKHSHYFKDVRHLKTIDVYRVLELFDVTDPTLQHVVKKALAAGQRKHKTFEHDIQDIFDTTKRKLEMLAEDALAND